MLPPTVAEFHTLKEEREVLAADANKWTRTPIVRRDKRIQFGNGARSSDTEMSRADLQWCPTERGEVDQSTRVGLFC